MVKITKEHISNFIYLRLHCLLHRKLNCKKSSESGKTKLKDKREEKEMKNRQKKTKKVLDNSHFSF